MVCVTYVGGWLIFTVAPIEVKTHTLKHKSPEQTRLGQLAKLLIPAAAIGGLGVGWLLGMAFGLLLGAVLLAPLGYLAMKDDWNVDAHDRDISTFIRAIGGVMGSAGITATDALSRLNRRSLGSLEPSVRRLYIRLKNGIAPDLCWVRLAAESGSDLVVRCVRIFWDGVRVGGDTEKVATLSSEFALKIWLLRADRKLVSTTFSWVAVPLHAVLMAILLFITEVVQVFGAELGRVQQQSLEGGVAAEAGVGDILLLQFASLDFIPMFVGVVAIMLTAANSFAPYAATGGHRLKLCLYAAIMMAISGVALLVVPHLVQAVFENIASSPASPTAVPTPIAGGA
jgi:flagellar protein FlaJ